MFKRLFSRVEDRFTLKYDKQIYENILDDPNSRLWIFLSNTVVLLVIISILVLVIESVWNIWILYKRELFIIDYIISSIFLVEYLYRFIRARNKSIFVKYPLNIIDVLAFVPFFIWILFSAFIWAEVLKVLRVMRVFRVLKLAKHLPVIVGFIKALKDYKNEYRGIIILFIIVLTIISVFMFHAENWANSEMFSSIPKSLWWAIVTMTTVWYWDMYPITTLWKLIWTILIFLWPVLLALVSSITILVFMDVLDMQRWKTTRFAQRKCKRCKTKNDTKANYCIKCGKEYKKH